MADVRYFRVEKDTALPRAYRAVRDNSGTVYDYETEGVAYDAGSYVASPDIDPRVLERLDDGDEHLNSLLTEVNRHEVEEYDASLSGQEARLPEHSVEAYVLSRDEEQPYDLLTVEEGLEQKSAGAEEAKEAQEQAKEDGGDEVPAEADDRSAIDYAAAKGAADKEAGKSLPVSESADKPKSGKSKKAAASDAEKTDENKDN